MPRILYFAFGGRAARSRRFLEMKHTGGCFGFPQRRDADTLAVPCRKSLAECTYFLNMLVSFSSPVGRSVCLRYGFRWFSSGSGHTSVVKAGRYGGASWYGKIHMALNPGRGGVPMK